jgi:hypothetical protein
MMKMILALLFQGVFPMFLGLGTPGAIKSAAQTNENVAQNAVGQYGTQATSEGQFLNPLFMREATATHGFDPGQTNELLTAAEGGAGGAFGGAEGVLEANAARTGNATGIAKSLDEMARDRAKAAAGASEGVAAADINAAKQLNQQGAEGLRGLYGTNVSAQLGAMKAADEALKTQSEVQGPNWLGQLDQIAKFGTDVAGDITGGAKAAKVLRG